MVVALVRMVVKAANAPAAKLHKKDTYSQIRSNQLSNHLEPIRKAERRILASTVCVAQHILDLLAAGMCGQRAAARLFRSEGIEITPKYVNSHDSVYRSVAKGLYAAEL